MVTDGGDTPHYKVLSIRMIWAATGVVVVVGVAVAVWLLLAFGGGDAQQRNQLEAIRTAGTIVIGTGGAVALLLAARRQRTAEIALKQKDLDQLAVTRTHELQERVAEDVRLNATERRVTELYTRAVDQLGSDKLPVQLGGLYALERLGQGNVDQRQTIVNVLCAYLRMFTDAAADVDTARQPQQRVREAAGAILATHLREDRAFWPDIDLDLSGASLLGFDLANCRVRSATFRAATFVDDARFARTVFAGDVTFEAATFTGAAGFGATRFDGPAVFESAMFSADAVFTAARFAGGPRFDGATFAATAGFDEAVFDAVPFAELPPDTVKALTSLPTHVAYADIAASREKLVPIGVSDGGTAGLDFAVDPHFVAFMGPKSGKTTLVRTILRGIVDRYTDKEAVILLVDFRRGLRGYLDTKHLLAYAVRAEQLKDMLVDVRNSLRKRLPGPHVTAEQLKNRTWWKGPDLFIVVDDHELTRHRGEDLLEPLREFVPQAKDVGLHLVLVRSTEGAAAGDTVVEALRDVSTPGLVGNGDLREGPLLGEVWPSALMPGRAVALDRLSGRRLVQVAWTGPAEKASDDQGTTSP
ncbi:pentapeptide repeat-containing protein [Actinophytocola algeriensis]|uniref:FtsK domain-containing protein n=1 Tax=Actinophytocola algeriensis TaxID=1768010 RepID=A0A7W7Q2M7_9PSEU|nr:pentapeptide repeat-containing protein [Actinophytocola algeriensis]MBB4905827.1 hypothetical protein [Actinophytocola algeriensis]MBE1472488.1 hypothetical protein [Actinophytocola algeriensis]